VWVLGAVQALKRCQLGDVIEKQPLGLDSPGIFDNRNMVLCAFFGRIIISIESVALVNPNVRCYPAKVGQLTAVAC
jgi:hypothetical protein